MITGYKCVFSMSGYLRGAVGEAEPLRPPGDDAIMVLSALGRELIKERTSHQYDSSRLTSCAWTLPNLASRSFPRDLPLKHLNLILHLVDLP